MTKEKKKNNEILDKLGNVGKKIVKFVKDYRKPIIGILVIFIVLFLLTKLFSKPGTPDYPVIYNDSDGDIYLTTTKVNSKEESIKLATGQSVSKVTYANTTNRYVLFQKDEALYIYDAKKKGETEKIIDDIAGSNYYFTKDDKYVIALDEEKNIRIYNFKKTEKIESNVTSIVDYSNDKILFEKDNTLYIRSIKPSKDDKKKITDDYNQNIKFSKDGKNVIYLDTESNLYIYNVKKDKKERISENVSSYYCDEKSCDKMYYIQMGNEKVLYYYDSKDDTKVETGIYSLLAYDVEKQQIVFSKLENKKYELYYKKGTKKTDKVDGNLDNIRFVKLFNNKDIYYVTGDNKAKYARVNGARVTDKENLAEKVSGYIYEYNKGFAFVADVSDSYSGKLYVAKNGKAKVVDEEVNSGSIVVNTDGNRIYYIKDSNTSGDLYYTNGNKNKRIETDVHTFEYVKDNLIYIIKDYSSSKSRGDLYRYTNKSVKIAENVNRVASIPVYYGSNK
jgi:hypothetical protein